MARFSAYTSDSSDSGSESSVKNETRSRRVPESVQEEDESDIETSSSSSSDLHEDELLPSPSRRKQPTRNALVEDGDGEIYYAHEISGHDQTSPRSSPTRIRADPTIIPWAQHIGVDAQKMHVMQTSLFRMPEEAAALKAMNQPPRSHKVVPPILHRKHSRDSEGDVLRADPRERASFAHNIEPPLYRPSRKYARVQSSASVITGQERSMVDAGLAMGRSFRAGWGPGGMLVHLGEICSPSSTPQTSANSSIITMATISTFPSPGSEKADLAAKLLQHHLTNSPIEPDEDGIPFANPSSNICFASFVSLFSPTDHSYEALLFRLGHALFDDIDLQLGASITSDVRHRLAVLHRRAALSEWLENAVSPAVDAGLKDNPSADSAAVAFTLLTGNRVDKACDVSMDSGNVKLATLISQAAGDYEFKDDLRTQLQIWREQRIDVHIDVNIRKVYALLAGIVDVVEGSKRTGVERCADVDIIKALDWKRTFGVHLWFSEPVDASIAHVFQAYNQLRKDSPARVTPPLPWYTENPSESKSSPWKLPSSTPPPDALFSLIRLHADPACSLSHILTPFSFGPSPVDYSLSWHLYILLSRSMRVRDFADRGDPGGDVDMDGSADENTRVEGHSPSADLLASSYAFQLEQMGMIQEALFVLLHVEGSKGREKVIKEVLSRSAHRLDEWMTRGIVGSLKIPLAWVNEAKAIHALDNGKVYKAYELYMTANLFNQAHDLAVLELAPDAVIRKDLPLLKDLFAKIAGQSVNDWHVRGKAFLDYVHIMTRLPELHEQFRDQDAVPDASQALEVEDLTRSVPRLIGILPDVLRDRSDMRHNAALAEMIAGLIVMLDKVQPLALAQSQVLPMLVDGATKLRHIRSTAYERFRATVEVR